MVSIVSEYLEKAEESIRQKNFEDFMRFIGGAEAVSADADSWSQLLYVKAKGFYRFGKWEHALEAIETALAANQNMKNYVRLAKFKASILAYKGQYREAMRLLKELLAQTDDHYLRSEIYINISWVLLEYYKREPMDETLDEVKFYLDEADEIMMKVDSLDKKRRILNNYAEYYKFKKDYESARKMLEEELKCCTESELPEVYNDLAQVYLEQGHEDVMEKFLHDAELIASRYDNDMEVARALYTKAIALMKRNERNDLISVIDSLSIAFYNFTSCGAYNNAFDCFITITEVCDTLKHDCATTLKEQIKEMFSETACKNAI